MDPTTHSGKLGGPPKVTFKVDEDVDGNGDGKKSRSIPILPTEVIRQIAHHLPRSDQVNCLLVSQSFLEAVTPIIWRHVRLSEIRTRGTRRSSLALKFLSYIRILEIDGRHHPTVCNGLGKCLTALDKVVWDMSNKANQGRICVQELCGCFPIDTIKTTNTTNTTNKSRKKRDIGIIMHNTKSPSPTILHGLGVIDDDKIENQDGSSERSHVNLHHLTVYYTIPALGDCWLNPNPIIEKGYMAQLINPDPTSIPISSMTLVFKPLTTNTLSNVIQTWSWRIPPFNIKPEWYNDPTTLSLSGLDTNTDIDTLGYDIISTLAFACVKAPKECRIEIVNMDQMPFNQSLSATYPHATVLPITKFILRSSSGMPVVIQSRSQEAGAGPGTGGGGKVDKVEWEETLRDQKEKIMALVKRWMLLLLEREKRGDELEERWERIRFIGLHEYKDLERDRLRTQAGGRMI